MKAEKPDTCWSFNIDDIDQPWDGYYTPNIYDVKAYKGGFLAAGFVSQALFPSKDKKVQKRNTWTGEYLCRYDVNGNYMWHLNTNMSDFHSHNERPYIASVTADKNDMIYIGGNTGKDAVMYTPSNITVKIAYCPENPYYHYNGYIAKIDTNGSILWGGVFPGGVVKKVVTDSFGNVYVLGQTKSYLQYYDGKVTTFLYTSIQDKSDFIIVLDTSGKIRWHTYFMQNYTNIGGARDLDVDSQGNVYIGGIYENEVRFYSADGTFFEQFGSGGEYGGRLFLTKINHDGVVQWVLASVTGRTSLEALEVDDIGNCFVAGTLGSMFNQEVYFINADKTAYKAKSAGYLVLKVSKSGIVEWESGNLGSKYGYANDIVLRKNQISVIGSIKKDETIDDWSGKLYTNKGQDTTITLTMSEYFVVNYDTSGYIRYVARSGTKAGTLMQYEVATIDRDENGHIISVNGRKSSTPFHVDFFGNKVLLTGIDGIIARIGNSPCDYNNTTSVDEGNSTNEGEYDKSFLGLTSENFANVEHIDVMTILGEKFQKINLITSESVSSLYENLNNGLYCVVVKYKNGCSDFKKILVDHR